MQTTTTITNAPPFVPRTAGGIAFDDAGDGDLALLLMPGWCGPRTVFRPLLAALTGRVRALALDWRGHGDSAPAAGDFGYPELLDDARAVLDAAGVRRVIPVGLAHAGWAAFDLRRALGAARVPAVALIDWMVLGAPPPFFGALAGLQDPAGWSQVRDALFSMWTTGVESRAVHDYVAEMARSDRAMWARAGREIGARFAAAPDPLASFAEEQCPTLHVYAQPADPRFLSAQQAYAAAHPWFTVHRLDGRSHFPPLEVPAELATRLLALAASV
jgi:pimeloyl-ACP methyl ester carboxylesterase